MQNDLDGNLGAMNLGRIKLPCASIAKLGLNSVQKLLLTNEKTVMYNILYKYIFYLNLTSK